MPLYEYRCEACDHRFETIQKFSDPPLEECPKCKGRVSKLQSAPAFQFKGSGWYITDYARKASGASGGQSETGGDSSAEASSKDSGQTAQGDAAVKKGEEKPAKTEKTDKAEKTEKSTAAPTTSGAAGAKNGS
jgi:putative FmdB family regulatory protein